MAAQATTQIFRSLSCQKMRRRHRTGSEEPAKARACTRARKTQRASAQRARRPTGGHARIRPARAGRRRPGTAERPEERGSRRRAAVPSRARTASTQPPRLLPEDLRAGRLPQQLHVVDLPLPPPLPLGLAAGLALGQEQHRAEVGARGEALEPPAARGRYDVGQVVLLHDGREAVDRDVLQHGAAAPPPLQRLVQRVAAEDAVLPGEGPLAHGVLQRKSPVVDERPRLPAGLQVVRRHDACPRADCTHHLGGPPEGVCDEVRDLQVPVGGEAAAELGDSAPLQPPDFQSGRREHRRTSQSGRPRRRNLRLGRACWRRRRGRGRHRRGRHG
mmetsp:Transcript_47299/g.148212  ORF Transcript_47299/g.148212 Transcript_47299/m.148212 type:complete len:331 (-) Transcript_47299:346-1338(-)